MKQEWGERRKENSDEPNSQNREKEKQKYEGCEGTSG